MVRRLTALRELFGVDEPSVFILAPAVDRPIPAGDTRRGTAWIFRQRDTAGRFSSWLAGRHRITTVPVELPLRSLLDALSSKDLTWVLDPEPRPGHGTPQSFKAPLRH